MSADTYERIRELVAVRGTVTAEFKGVDHPVTLYDVRGLGGADRLSLPEAAGDVLVALGPPLPVACFPVEGKVVAVTPIRGVLARLGRDGAELALETPVALHANLKVVLEPASGARPGELYAKVGAEGDGTRVRVAFTALTDEVRAVLEGARGAAPA